MSAPTAGACSTDGQGLPRRPRPPGVTPGGIIPNLSRPLRKVPKNHWDLGNFQGLYERVRKSAGILRHYERVAKFTGSFVSLGLYERSQGSAGVFPNGPCISISSLCLEFVLMIPRDFLKLKMYFFARARVRWSSLNRPIPTLQELHNRPLTQKPQDLCPGQHMWSWSTTNLAGTLQQIAHAPFWLSKIALYLSNVRLYCLFQ